MARLPPFHEAGGVRQAGARSRSYLRLRRLRPFSGKTGPGNRRTRARLKGARSPVCRGRRRASRRLLRREPAPHRRARERAQDARAVLALRGTVHLGEIRLFPTVVATSDGRADPPRLQEALGVVNVPAPDLSLLILESRRGTETVLDLRLTALDPSLGLNLARFGPIV